MLNTVVLSLYYYGMSSDFEKALEDINLTFTIIFVIEMGIKLIGMGFVGYFKEGMNYLDCVIVIYSIIELLLI